MVNGGHAQNALPQRATANIDTRIFPATAVAIADGSALQINDAKVTLADVTSSVVSGPRGCSNSSPRIEKQ